MLIKIVEVPCSQKRAFRVFVNGMSNWWPLRKSSVSIENGKFAKSLHIEPRLGGKIVEIGDDDAEHHWGTIKLFGPHDSISIDFHMGQPAEAATIIHVRFVALTRERTRVELTHGNWEACGELAGMIRDRYRSHWTIVFGQAFKTACVRLADNAQQNQR